MVAGLRREVVPVYSDTWCSASPITACTYDAATGAKRRTVRAASRRPAGGSSVSVAGTSGDGKITLILAAIGILCGILSLHGEKNKSGWASLGAVAFVLAGAVSIYHISSLPIPSTNFVIVSVGIGLWLCTIGSIVGFIAACFATYSSSKAPVATPAASSATALSTPPEGRDPAS
jgi:hypothetical protein